jgi:type IV secretion system protein VirB11
MMLRLAQIAAHTSQGVSREYPCRRNAAGWRAVQIVCRRRTHFALAIRKHVVQDLTLDNYEASGAFAGAKRAAGSERAEKDAELQSLLDRGDMKAFFSQAVKAGRNIVISGGTGTGRQRSECLLKEVPQGDRLIVIEDTPEVKLAHPMRWA